MAEIPKWNIGAQWHRWDPHVHTPGTLKNDQFKGDWDGFLSKIETAVPAVAALGITDYCTLNSYKEFVARWKTGRAQNVNFVFPNIELRLTIETEKKKGINLHLIFNPEDPNHENEIERFLSSLTFTFKGQPYRCVPTDLVDLGRKFDTSVSSDEAALRAGVNQFKVEFVKLRDAYLNNEWARTNCLVAVAASPMDGTAGLQKDAGFAAVRQELHAFAHIIFSGNPVDREFWLGHKPNHGRELIETAYGKLKPCLHGSDPHTVAETLQPDGERNCWIRSRLSFSGLKQTILEPEFRVFIGKEPPPSVSKSERIESIEVTNASWLLTGDIPLNDGLVAIIGPKGSGKTALADFIAHTAGAAIEDESSFLLKAKDLIGAAAASLSWGDGTNSGECPLSSAGDDPFGSSPLVRYLSQQFVERLCSSDGLGNDLVEEIETVVFRAIPEGDRLGAANFNELRTIRIDQMRQHRDEYLQEIQRLSEKIAAEELKKKALPDKKKHLEELTFLIAKQERQAQDFLPKEKKKETDELQLVQRAKEVKNHEVGSANLKLRKLNELVEELAFMRDDFSRKHSNLQERFVLCGITDQQWLAFLPGFSSNPDDIVADALLAQKRLVKILEEGDSSVKKDPKNFTNWSLKDLTAREKALTDAIGQETTRAKRYKELTAALADSKLKKARLHQEVADASDADKRRKTALDERRKVYASVFETFVRDQKTLEDLYAPLTSQMAKDASQRLLQFFVRRKVDIDGWVKKGEDLLDLRRAGTFNGKGSLKDEVSKHLLETWKSGGAKEVSEALDKFLESFGAALAGSKADTTSMQELGRWLFSTDHISLEYGIRYDGVDLKNLSPGMRGIVLLILYLAIDEWDSRPLVVDQPEENLDPKSVYDELVGYFRAAKRRRQVILVTHNPNLVVNADADQVIVARADRQGGEALPKISYISGGLEDRVIRDQVCQILEGGERAFLEREMRYDLPRDFRGLHDKSLNGSGNGWARRSGEAGEALAVGAGEGVIPDLELGKS